MDKTVKPQPSGAVLPTNGGLKSNGFGGKTNEQMKSLGRAEARYVAQGKKV